MPIKILKQEQPQALAGNSFFLLLLDILAGIAAKFASGMINWVLAVYFINLVCLAVNWAVYFRNCRLDAARLANKQAARIIDSSVNTLLIATDGSKASLEAITFAAHAIDLKKVENIEVLSVAESTSEISAGGVPLKRLNTPPRHLSMRA